jgi:uncharacterized protein
MDLTGPAAGADEVQGADEVIGTLADCGGGVTLWNTVLTCEENYQDYYGERTLQNEPGSSEDAAADQLKTDRSYRWFDDTENAQPSEHYGWIAEVVPFDPESKPRKHTWLGRLRHENAAVTLSESGKVVVYTGHDQEDQRIYKFISSANFDPNNREANFDLLTDGMLLRRQLRQRQLDPPRLREQPHLQRQRFCQPGRRPRARPRGGGP